MVIPPCVFRPNLVSWCHPLFPLSSYLIHYISKILALHTKYIWNRIIGSIFTALLDTTSCFKPFFIICDYHNLLLTDLSVSTLVPLSMLSSFDPFEMEHPISFLSPNRIIVSLFYLSVRLLSCSVTDCL